MARPDKAAAVAELTEEFRSSNGAVLTEYRGLSVKQLQELRRSLGDTASYAVVKNTLTRIAARDAGLDGLEDLLVGPSAIAFIKGDPVEAAKSLRDFGRANQPLVIKGGVLDGKSVTPADIARFADLESREVLLAKMAGAMTASLSGAAALFAAPIAQAARLAEALRAKAEEDPSILTGGTGAAAEAVTSEGEPTEDAPIAAEPADDAPTAAAGDEAADTTPPAPEAAETADAPEA